MSHVLLYEILICTVDFDYFFEQVKKLHYGIIADKKSAVLGFQEMVTGLAGLAVTPSTYYIYNLTDGVVHKHFMYL